MDFTPSERTQELLKRLNKFMRKRITPIEEAWSSQGAPEVTEYSAGSDGPTAAEELLARNGHRWRQLHDIVGCD